MYRFMRAGFNAACLQMVLATIVVFLMLAQGGTQQGVPTPEFLTTTALDADRRAALALVDVLMAACVSLLRTSAVTWSARQLSAGFRRLSPRNPDRAAVALISQLLLASLGFVALALRPPPDWFQSLAAPLTGFSSGFLIWPGIMSIGIAAFGATMHASVLASHG